MRSGFAGRMFGVLLACAVVASACSGDDADLPTSTGGTDTGSPAATATATSVPGQHPFVSELLAVGNQVATVSGYRTDTETVIDIALPPGVRLEPEPSLMVGGHPAPVAGGGQEQEGGTAVATVQPKETTDSRLELHFGAVPDGVPVAVNLGVFEADPNVPSISVTVAVGKVLQRNGATKSSKGSYPVEPGDVLDGPASMVVSVDNRMSTGATTLGHCWASP